MTQLNWNFYAAPLQRKKREKGNEMKYQKCQTKQSESLIWKLANGIKSQIEKLLEWQAEVSSCWLFLDCRNAAESSGGKWKFINMLYRCVCVCVWVAIIWKEFLWVLFPALLTVSIIFHKVRCRFVIVVACLIVWLHAIAWKKLRVKLARYEKN